MLSVLMFFATLLGGVILSLRHSIAIAFVVYQAIYFFNPEKRWWGNIVPDISYSFFIVIFMALLVLANGKITKENKISKAPPLKWSILVMLTYCVAYFYAIAPEYHYTFMIYFIKLIVIMCLAYKLISSAKDFTYVLYGYIFSAWYVSFYVFQIGRNAGNRVEGVGLVDSPDANGLAAAIAPSLVLTLYYYWISKKYWMKGMFAIAGLFIANAVVLINSRGAFLAVAASIAFFMYFMYTSSFQRKHQKKMAVFITIAGLSGALYIADDDFISRITGITGEVDKAEKQESGATRLVFWEAAWEMAKDYPYGNGYRGFNYLSPFYIPEGIDTGGNRSRSVHSTWFETLTEVGYLGLLFFIMMLWSAWKHLNKVRSYLRGNQLVDEYFKIIALQGSLIAFVIAMTFLNRMRAEVLYWLIMFSAAAYNVYVLKKYAGQPNSQNNT